MSDEKAKFDAATEALEMLSRAERVAAVGVVIHAEILAGTYPDDARLSNLRSALQEVQAAREAHMAYLRGDYTAASNAFYESCGLEIVNGVYRVKGATNAA